MFQRARYFSIVIIVLIALSACGTPTQPATSPPIPSSPTPIPPTATPAPLTAEPTAAPIAMTTFEDMAGVYYREHGAGDMKLRINEDGSAYLTYIGGTTYPQDLWFENGQLHVRENIAIGDDCEAGQTGIYEMSGVQGQRISFSLVQDPCKSDRRFAGTWTSDPIE